MKNKIQIPQPRLDQLRSLIQIEAQKKTAAATKIIEDKKELNHTLQSDAFKYQELFGALSQFNFDHYDVFSELAWIQTGILQSDYHKKQDLLWVLSEIATLLNQISSKGVFIDEKKQEYETLLSDLEHLNDVDFDPEKF